VLAVGQGPSLAGYWEAGGRLPARISVADAQKLLVQVDPKRIKDGYKIQQMVDKDNDGKPDPGTITDQNKDGIPDAGTMTVDKDKDGKPDLVDLNKDGKPDPGTFIDKNNDGKPDPGTFVDANKDGIPDALVTAKSVPAAPPIIQQGVRLETRHIPNQATMTATQAGQMPLLQQEMYATGLVTQAPPLYPSLPIVSGGVDMAAARYYPTGAYLFPYRMYGGYYYPYTFNGYAPFLYDYGQNVAMGAYSWPYGYSSYGVWPEPPNFGYFGAREFQQRAIVR